MLKKSITFTDYDGEKVTKEYRFHLSKFEWLELEAYTKGGLVKNLDNALDTGNNKKVIDILRKLILRAYGEKDSETGEFCKSDEMAVAFSKSEAFSELFFELAYDGEKSKEFFMGLIPPDMQNQLPTITAKM